MTNDKTKWIFDEKLPAGDDEDAGFTESIGTGGAPDPTFVGNNEATVAYDRPNAAPEKTVMFYQSADLEENVDPVTGWLVVVKGPGLGRSVRLGAGMNAIGRSPEMRAPLHFGDRSISSADHLRIIYDDAERSFFVVPGSSGTVSRLNGAIIATTTPLAAGAQIQLSKSTTVVFVPFCSDAFDWSDVLEDGAATD